MNNNKNNNFYFTWPSEEPIIIKNFSGTNVDILKEKFGALSQDERSAYSRICMGNSLISLEPYRGCPLGCKYCMANNDVRSLNNTICEKEKMILRKPELLFEPKLLVKALLSHPAFIPDKTVIGFCTGSTEFFLPEISEMIWEGLLVFIDNGLKNPLWIVAKSFLDYGNERKWVKRFDKLYNNGNGVVLSISDIDADKNIEPFQKDRFEQFAFLKDTNVHISHHMRPLIPDENWTYDRVANLLNKSTKYAQSICVGGLRIDPGMAIFWEKIANSQYKYIPGNQAKHFDGSIVDMINTYLASNGINIPVFLRTSEMINYHLGTGEYNLYKYKSPECFLKVNLEKQREIEDEYGKNILKVLNDIARSISLHDIYFCSNGENIFINKQLKYQEERALVHAIGHSRILE